METKLDYDSANNIDLNKKFGEDEIDASGGVNSHSDFYFFWSSSEIEIDGVDDGKKSHKDKEDKLNEPHISMEFNFNITKIMVIRKSFR